MTLSGVVPRGLRWILGAGVLSCIAAASLAVTVEDVFREPSIEGERAGGAQISPDEKWVAYAWNPDGFTYPRDLYVVSTAGGEPRALTHFERRDSADSLQHYWHELRSTLGRGGNDSLKTLPRYFGGPGERDVVGEIAWSPDSKRIAFSVQGDLYVVGARDGRMARLTHTHAWESSPLWSPDGRWLAFLRGDAVWMLEPDGARELQLTEDAGDDVSLTTLRWAPDGRRLAVEFQDDRGRGRLVVPHYLPERVRDEGAREGYPTGGVRVVHLDPILDKNDPQAIYRDDKFKVVELELGEGKHPWIPMWAWSPNSRWLAVDEVPPDMQTRRIHVADPESGKARVAHTEVDSAWIEEYDWVVTDGPSLAWAPDSRSLTFLSDRPGFPHVFRLNLDVAALARAIESTTQSSTDSLSFAAAPQALTSGNWEVAWARWHPNGEQILLLTSREDHSQRHLEILDVKSGALQRLQTAPGTSSHPLLGERGGLIVFRHSQLGVPPDLWSIATSPGRAPKQLTDTVPRRYEDVAWNIPEIVHFDAYDGTPLRGFVYKPDNFVPGQRYPVVVFVHGAGVMQNVVDGWTVYSPNFKFHSVLTKRGFGVFEVDYRGSLGYGRDFRAGTRMYIGGKDLQDELAGLDYLEKLRWVDSERIGIYGGSYGGFMALMALFLAPERYAAGAALRFVSDWENYYRGNPWYCIQRLGKPEDNPAAYYRSSPIHFAENLEDPLLLLHGVRDNNVHFQDAAQLTERLIRLGKDFELMVYPVERHGFTAPESWIDEYERIEEFFVRHLQPQGAN